MTKPEKNTRKRAKRSTATKAMYTNHIELRPGTWDLTALCGRYLADEATGQWELENHAAITIQWGMAKTLLFQLTAHIISYELRYGPIAVSQQLFPLMPTADQAGPDGIAHLALLKEELLKATPSTPGAGKPEPARPDDVGVLGAIVADTSKKSLH